MASHSFKETTFGRLTYCDKCNGLLWGLVRQGVKCEDCGYSCHQGCKSSAPRCAQQTNNTYPTTLSSKIQQKLYNNRRREPLTVTNKARPIQTPLASIKELVTVDYIEQAVISAAIQSMDDTLPVNDYLATLPPLHPQSTAKNFSRFVSRCGPIFAFRDQVILLLSWDQPIDTFVALVAYCIVCFYPKLLLFIPQLILLYILIGGYYKRFGDKQHGFSVLNDHTKGHDGSRVTSTNHAITNTTIPSGGLTSTEDSDATSSPTRFSGATTTNTSNTTAAAGAAAATAVSASSAAGGGPTRRSAFAFSLATALFPMFDETSPEYGRNLQNMQNMMGETSDVYDLVQSHGHYFDWSDEDTSLKILQGVLLSMVGLSAAIYFIPFHLICLVGGVSMFMVNTRFCKYLVKELNPMLVQLNQQLMPWVRQQDEMMENYTQPHDHILEISIYENQRWSKEDLDFTSHLLRNERAAWSDYSGNQERSSINQESTAPKQYHWIEDEWILDTIGSWKEETLGIGRNFDET
ncbi:integral peroxisomal membrane peroxin-domain-containing protein [Chlamydoabsidia padenii]|nr:integral peroxisomal membrane peroxin-domain-containing protein [Chlamydoabsidia padenii]